jgi:hypothetical protein
MTDGIPNLPPNWVNEADQLRAERDKARAAVVDLVLEVERLRPIAAEQNNSYKLAATYFNELENASAQNKSLAKERDEAIKERDEARREVCYFHHITGFLAGDYAYSRKWDCFPSKEYYGMPDPVKEFRQIIEQDYDTLRKQRDEARREVCMLSVGKGGRSSSASPDAIEEADKRGWECFKDNV